jgi:hypothetical protein
MKKLLFLLMVFFSISGLCQQKEQRVALVIGNGAYKASPLKNPVNDARDMADKLRSFGFTVIERSNLGMKQIGSTLREFRSKITPGSVALVFYAGHGLQIKGENYLPAVDAEIGGEEDVPNQSMSMRQIMNVLSDAKTRLNLVFLDACRDNPYARSFRNSSGGLAKEDAPSGTLISFATRPGSVASDGDGRNGLYTGALLAQMNNTSLPIEQVLKGVVTSVKGSSSGRQEPWMEGSIEGDFCFGDCVARSAPQVAMSDDRALWESVKDSRDVNEFKVYLNKFPKGIFADLANTRMKALSSSDIRPLAMQGGGDPVPNPNRAQSTVINCVGLDPLSWNNCIGTFTYPNGNKYTSEFKNGRRDGNGTIRIVAKGTSTSNYIGSDTPATYVGEFRDDRLNGHGVWTTDGGSKIEGDFVNNILVKKN